MSAFTDDEEAARLVAVAKRDKEAAKDLRDEGDIEGAVRLLRRTVATFDASPLVAGLENLTGEAGKPQVEVATQLADCLGMLGGNLRRLGRLHDAQACFDRGRMYEESSSLNVMSSYNLVNSLTLPLESEPDALTSRRTQLEAAIAAITRQAHGARRNDRWAWADLAQCQLLLGDTPSALQSYRRVRDLGGEETVQSVVTVLRRLGTAVVGLKPGIDAAIEQLSG